MCLLEGRTERFEVWIFSLFWCLESLEFFLWRGGRKRDRGRGKEEESEGENGEGWDGRSWRVVLILFWGFEKGGGEARKRWKGSGVGEVVSRSVMVDSTLSTVSMTLGVFYLVLTLLVSVQIAKIIYYGHNMFSFQSGIAWSGTLLFAFSQMSASGVVWSKYDIKRVEHGGNVMTEETEDVCSCASSIKSLLGSLNAL